MRATVGLAVVVLITGLACAGSSAPTVGAPAPASQTSAASATAAVTPATGALQPGTLCRKGEDAELVCGTKGGKVLSLCKAGPVLRYRFGKLDQIELEWPEHDEPFDSPFRWESSETNGCMTCPPPSQTSTLSFVRDGTTYTIEERLLVHPPDVVIHVAMADGKTVDLKCDQDVEGSLSDLGYDCDLPIQQTY